MNANEPTNTLPIYLLECHVWSDGEDDHEEDHNLYYDMHIVFLVNEPISIITFSWNANSTYEDGIITQWKNPMHIQELQYIKAIGYMPCDILKRLVHEEVGWHKRHLNNDVPPECIRAAQVLDML